MFSERYVINSDVMMSRYIPRLWKIDVVYGKIGGNVEALAESARCHVVQFLSSPVFTL